MLTDNGSSLKSGLGEEMLELLKIEHKLTVAYSHEENALIERWNHEIVRYLRAIVFDKNSIESWSDLLPFAQRICNSEVISSTGVSPAQIIFGGAINLDRGILVPNIAPAPAASSSSSSSAPTNGPPESLNEYVVRLREAQGHAMEYARRIQKEKDDEHMMASGSAITEFKIGSFVTLSYPPNQSAPSKLMTKRRGPYVVLGHTGSTYKLKNLADEKVTDNHVSRLEIFRYDVGSVDPQAIAAKDLREFVVEAIVEHEPTIRAAKNKPTLRFFVKWRGYDASHNEWVPWHDLTNNEICLRYCYYTHGLRSLVSKKYRDQILAGIEGDEEASEAASDV